MASKKASRPSNLGTRSPAHADPLNTDRASAALKAWHQLLVARGNRLIEIATREREALASQDAAGRPSSPRKASHHGGV